MICFIGILKRSIWKGHREVTALKSGGEFVRCKERVIHGGTREQKGQSRSREPTAVQGAEGCRTGKLGLECG